jgi:site-specific DNA-methyltransferase (adenine-specific)
VADLPVNTVICGDCLQAMKAWPACSIDAIVCDPPYGLEFMGKEWDSFKEGDIAMRRNPQMDAVNTGASRQGGRQRACADYQRRQARDMLAFQEAMRCVFVEALRVAKPGAHLLAFGGTRTYHRLACAIEDAGWEIRDQIGWAYGSGFPKSHDVSKAIDREAGAEREVVGENPNRKGRKYHQNLHEGYQRPWQDRPDAGAKALTVPATPLAKQWQGWGTALKPAWEPVVVARKPLEGTVAENVLKWGVGALNVDGCRIAVDPNVDDMLRQVVRKPRETQTWEQGSGFKNESNSRTGVPASGRWPANLIHDGSEEVLRLFPQSSITGKRSQRSRTATVAGTTWGTDNHESTEYTDSGSAARFFYCAKASRNERWFWCKVCNCAANNQQAHRDHAMHCHDCGVDYAQEATAESGTERLNQNNHQNNYRPGSYSGKNQHKGHNVETNLIGHPTVKPLSLMRYLCRLVTPPGGTVLDCFAGSGSTLIAAREEGFNFVGIEKDETSWQTAKERLKATDGQRCVEDAIVPVKEARAGQMALFGAQP